MPRRRYRLLTVCAVVIVIMLYRVAQNSWDEPPPYTTIRQPPQDLKPEPEAEVVVEKPLPEPQPPSQPESAPEAAPVSHADEDASQDDQDASQEEDTRVRPEPIAEEPDDVEIKVPTLKDHEGLDGQGTPTTSDTILPAGGGRPLDSADEPTFVEEKHGPLLSQNPPPDAFPEDPDSWKVHWEKVPETFPVPLESIITLPTGTPKRIPKIQYEFGIESEKAKTVRLDRLKQVKTELERSWTGYRKHGWMHDEVRPVTGKFRDPFCGWAATLVDSLDTLWIAGMKEEFDEAAKAVKEIDFTYTPKPSIPVFETTIRYLGGLVAAFDVSGGHTGDYPILLDKAVELAEILMGIFDTPNRMPLLYYQWKPEFASQPHHTGRVGMAELATLSMEFTRLAQLTGKQKYYDAVARITNALVDMQEAGTAIPGLFPENMDASGCNRTGTIERAALSEAAQKQLDTDELKTEPLGHLPATALRDTTGMTADVQPERRSLGDTASPQQAPNERAVDEQATGVESSDPDTEPAELKAPFRADKKTAAWDCEPQGLVPANELGQKFHMGGAQDSAYEYFPKEWLLLGGLEPKYKKLYEDTVEAVNEWLMYRPMTDDDWDILFPAYVTTRGHPETDIEPKFEITHLTCFIGGMYGLGGKIFGREKDLEMAKKLTDGCVWAYQSTRSGIMPENAIVVPCPTLEKCEFNQTLWWDRLDPYKDTRQAQIDKWELDQKKEEEENQNELRGDSYAETDEKIQSSGSIAETVRKTEERTEESLARDSTEDNLEGDLDSVGRSSGASSGSIGKRAAIPAPGSPDGGGVEELPSELPDSLKTKLGIDITPPKSKESKPDAGSGSGSGSQHRASGRTGSLSAEKSLQDHGAGPPKIPSQTTPHRGASSNEKIKPLSHEEFVSQKITKEGLYPGFTNVISRHYILRPEAIESVWYMYRITGDPTWMDKGWRMWEAVARATRSQFANSAVDNVLMAEPKLKDEMESFWIAETLKYYYLLFSETDVISLDDWVFNTEAHPFKRPS